MFKKKIIVVILVLTALILSVIPVGAYSVADINAKFYMGIHTLNSSSKIDQIDYSFKELVNSTNGVDVTLPFLDTGSSSHLGIVASYITFTFPEAKFVQGQSYNFKFTVSASQVSNNTAVYIPHKDYFYINQANLVLSQLTWFDEGETVPQWNNVYDKFYSQAGLDDPLRQPIFYDMKQLYNNQTFSSDIYIPSDYEEVYLNATDGSVAKVMNNQLSISIVIRTNYRNTSITLKDITLTPIGATKQLYSQQEHNQQVQEDLSNIQEGIDEGFSNVSGELEEGFSNLLEQPEQEKQEAGNTGNNALDSILGGVDDKSPGVINAFSSLVSALSYNGTEAKWQVPPIKIPAINGLWDEIVLSDNVEIDFNYWIDKIPPIIITLSQALTTIAFIIYCFKELYDIISYVFTLRRS